jgi:hypothetical protein
MEIHLMRKRLAVLLALCLTAIMTFGVISSAASFSFTSYAQQTLTVGQMTLKISSPTGGAHFVGDTLVCPDVLVLKSTGMDPVGCQIKVESIGSITPSKVTMTASAVTDGADMTKFMVQHDNGVGWASFPGGSWASVNGIVDTTSVFPSTALEQVYWTGLTNADQGKTVVVTYTFAAVE